MKRIIVVGGGISGLACARAIRELGRDVPGGIDVVLLEAASQPGGKIRTAQQGGFRVECGPNGFLDSEPRTLELARELGLKAHIRRAADVAADRFLWTRGALRPLPHSPASFLFSNLLSLRGRLRVLCEPLARSRRQEDESVAAFARRRLGREAARTLVSAMVLGVFGGDYERLSLRSTFPRMRQMEDEHGSLFAALRKQARARRHTPRIEPSAVGGPAGPAGVLTSFDAGMSEFPTALAADLAPALICKAPVQGLERTAEGWRVIVPGRELRPAQAVVLACEAFAAARILRDLDADLAALLDSVFYAPLDVVALGFSAAQIPHAVDGFGFLAPRGEGLRILGCLWDSSIFPGRAPEGQVLLRAMVGGATDGDASGLDEDELLALVRADLRLTLGIEAQPEFTCCTRWPRGIPQYECGHGDLLGRMDSTLTRHVGLHLTGNGYRGVALNSCIKESERVAGQVLAGL